MKRRSMFVGWKTILLIWLMILNTVIQCGLRDSVHPLSECQWPLCAEWKTDPKIHMALKGTPNSQDSLDKEQVWRIPTSRFQN